MRITAVTNVCISADMCALTRAEVFDQADDNGLVTVLLPDLPLREELEAQVRTTTDGPKALNQRRKRLAGPTCV